VQVRVAQKVVISQEETLPRKNATCCRIGVHSGAAERPYIAMKIVGSLTWPQSSMAKEKLFFAKSLSEELMLMNGFVKSTYC